MAHVRHRHADCRIVVGIPFLELYLLVRYGFLHSCGIEQRVLGTVTFRDNGDDGKHFSVFMPGLFGLQTNGVVYRLVSNHLVRGNIHETYGFGSGDDGRHLLVDGQLLQFLVGLLGESRQNREHCRNSGTDIFDDFIFLNL